MNTCMNRTEGNSHNTWNFTAAALTNLNSTITYKLQRNYTFHDTAHVCGLLLYEGALLPAADTERLVSMIRTSLS